MRESIKKITWLDKFFLTSEVSGENKNAHKPLFYRHLSGADGRGRTDTGLLPTDFESVASAISPHRQIIKLLVQTQ